MITTWLARILGSETVEPPRGDPARVRDVEAVLERVRPLLASDGGDVRIVAIEGDDVVIALRGACSACSVSGTTVRGAIEPELRARVPWFRSIRVA